jgi:deazaflavin-dependent oxidoreductase (nitroreductase family)
MGHEHLENPTDPEPGWQREHLHRYVTSRGAEGYLWDGMPVRPEPLRPGVPTLLLTTLGWRSGIPRRTPLIFGRHGDDYVVVASKGPNPTHPYWYRNLSADPRVRVQVRDECFDALASTASPPERPVLWAAMTKIWPDYDQYQSMVSREIPVVLLRRLGDD